MLICAIIVLIIGIICAFAHKDGCLATFICFMLAICFLILPTIENEDVTAKTQITVSTDEKIFIKYNDKQLEIWQHQKPKDFYYVKSNHHKVILCKYHSVLFGKFQELEIK